MQTWILDIECFPSLFFTGIKDFKNQTITNYEISERRDDREALYEALATFDGYLVTFNGLHYDEVVLKYFLKEYDKLKKLSVEKFLKEIKNISNHTIDSDKYPTSFDKIKWYKWYKGINWTSIDLLCYWSKMLRLSKKISLKSLGVQLCHDEVQELPYPHDKLLTADEIEEVVRYNNRNDLGVTEKLFVKMKEDILLRNYIEKEYGLPCYSYDAPKIAGELLIKDYCEQTYNDQEHESLEHYIREFKKSRYGPFTGKIKDIFPNPNLFQFKNPTLQTVYQEVLESDRGFSKEFNIIHGETRMTVSMGIGGIHNLLSNSYLQPSQNELIVSSDVHSMYPNIIINYICIRFPEMLGKYGDVKADRMTAKIEKNLSKDKLAKLILNSGSGILDNEHSPLYYPEGALRMRIIGQLTILKALDECLEKGYRVVALNTDSIDVIIDKSELEEYKKIIDKVGEDLRLGFEHDLIKKTIYGNINNYLQIAENGKVKRKGMFKHGKDIPLGDSVNEQVIPIALEKYFVEGVPVEEVIKKPWEHGIHIYDYCVSKKVSRDFDVIYNNEKQQQLNRYYFSKSGYYLFKRGNDKSKPKSYGKDQHMHKGVGVRIFNKFEELPWEDYKIDYSYYIAKANTLIKELEKDIRQLTLF